MFEMLTGAVEISDSVLYQAIDNEVVLLNMNTQRYFGLDEIGARMWTLLVEEHHLKTVAEHLRREFDVEPAVLEHDLERLVGALLHEGLLNTVPNR